MAKYTVALRDGFSDRNKIKEENTTIQTTEFDNRTRVALMNMTDYIIQAYFPDMRFAHVSSLNHQLEQNFMRNLLADVYSVVVDWSHFYHYDKVIGIVKDTFALENYDAILTVIEYFAKQIMTLKKKNIYYKGKNYTAESLYNLVFEQEYVGYRLINCEAHLITDENEIQSIQEAVASKHTEVQQHINKALGFLSDRQAPDYANSIKESISAVERMCSIIVGKSTTLGAALNILQKKGISIHSQLAAAFEKLYAYTNGASGIRHAGELDGNDATFEEAKYMLVSCCAFVNYLTGVMAKCP
ncbi:MAG: hypothetical protein IKW10_06645 [Oscillospiraceae bacterium]|nr:hypothetical protein [Oscillospiraceae bacterium]